MMWAVHSSLQCWHQISRPVHQRCSSSHGPDAGMTALQLHLWVPTFVAHQLDPPDLPRLRDGCPGRVGQHGHLDVAAEAAQQQVGLTLEGHHGCDLVAIQLQQLQGRCAAVGVDVLDSKELQAAPLQASNAVTEWVAR